MRRNQARRTGWHLLAFTTVLLLACGPIRETPEYGAAVGETEPHRGGVFQYATSTRLAAGVDPHDYRGTSANHVLYLVYDYLVNAQCSPDLRTEPLDTVMVPSLAERWEQPDPTTYIFHLRRGVTWHDGAPFTAADVLFTFDRTSNPAERFLYANNLQGGKWEKLDDYTVRISFKEPRVGFLEDLNLRIAPKHVVDQGGDLSKVAVGTGPYKLAHLELANKIGFLRNEGYWRAGYPYPDGGWVFQGMDSSAALAALSAGQTDLLNVVTPTQFETVRQAIPGIAFEEFRGANNWKLQVRIDKPPLNDLRVRKALHLAYDRDRLLQLAGGGNRYDAGPVLSPLTKTYALSEPDLLQLPGYRRPKEADIQEARLLLAAAGYPNGAGLRVTLSWNTAYSNGAPMIEPTIQLWKEALGIEVVNQPLEGAVWASKGRTGEYELHQTGGSPAGRDPTGPLADFRSTSPNNSYGLNDPKLDSLIDAQARELDPRRRAEIVRELQRYFLEHVLAVIPQIDLPHYALWQPYLHDYRNCERALTPRLREDIAWRFWLDERAPKRELPKAP